MAAYIGTIYPHKIAQKYWAILHHIGQQNGRSVLQRHVTSSPIPLKYTNRCRQNGGIYWHHLSAQNSPKILGYITPYRAAKWTFSAATSRYVITNPSKIYQSMPPKWRHILAPFIRTK